METRERNELKRFAAQIRLETVKEVGVRGFGHIGGALSVIEALAVLYGKEMRYRASEPQWADRDRLVMSKGHAGPAVYATLALKDFFPMEWLKTLNQPGTHLPSHCDCKLTPGIDMTTGSLGQGTSSAVGLAMAQKLDGKDSYVYLFTGDGELDEGQVWEAAMFAPNHGLDNLIWFVDSNHKQLDGTTRDILDLGDIAAKAKSFGWHTQSIDGGDVVAIADAVAAAKAAKGIPSCIVMDTVKGAGIPCVADIELNHHIVMEGDLLKQAVKCAETELKAAERACAG